MYVGCHKNIRPKNTVDNRGLYAILELRINGLGFVIWDFKGLEGISHGNEKANIGK